MTRNGRRVAASYYQDDDDCSPRDYVETVSAEVCDDLLKSLRRLLRCRRQSDATHATLTVPLHLIDDAEESIQHALYGD